MRFDRPAELHRPINAELDTTAVVIAALARDSRPTYSTLRAATGLANSTLKGTLDRLRRQGLVTWEDDKQGTIRATFEVVVL